MKNKVLNLIATQFNVDLNKLNNETSFFDDLNADSVDIVELVMSIEDEFDIEIDDSVLQNMSTVGDVLEYIEDME